MFNANFSDISVISWREQILLLNLNTYKFLRNKTYMAIKQRVIYTNKTNIKKIKPYI